MRAKEPRLSAKIQVGCSHEVATVPFVPAPGLLYRKFKAMKDVGVTDVMMCWYFGNYPGVMNKAAGWLAYEDFAVEEETSFLLRLARDDWGEEAPRVVRVWHPRNSSAGYFAAFFLYFSMVISSRSQPTSSAIIST